MYGCQCTKRLWLNKFQSHDRDIATSSKAGLFQSGTDIGLIARDLFPYGIDASPDTPYLYQQSVVKTANLIRKGVNTIYEAAFQSDGILAAVDILLKQNNKWYAFEVKGTGSVKPAHLQDAALQYHVLTRAGINLEDFSIIHLNTKYIRHGELDIEKLFTSKSVLKEVMELQDFIITKSDEFKTILESKQFPEIATGDHCFKPYDCDFYGYCSRGITDEPEEPEDSFINQMAIREFMQQIKYPLYYLDFETWMTPIPEQDGHWPFRPVPFQFSLHIQHEKGVEPEHKYYLADGPAAKHSLFADKLIECMGEQGSVIVYNKTFEKTILDHLKNDFEHLRSRIENIQDRMVDLMTPFRKNYRLPAMQWKYSIKTVLPALVPELSYDQLAITNGGDASSIFYNLKYEQDEIKRRNTRNALLDYCCLDTMAMVRILEKLAMI